MHLCCLPQSPVIGTFDHPIQVLLTRHALTLDDYHRQVAEEAQRRGFSHPCSVCEQVSAFTPAMRGTRKHLGEGGHRVTLERWTDAALRSRAHRGETDGR